MLLFRKPDLALRRRFIDEQTRHAFSYDAIGATKTAPPPGFVVDHTRITLGYGATTYRAASEALQRWSQFHLGWVDVWPEAAPLREGTVVSVLARVSFLWWLNACRVVYVMDEPRRFGFAYGTLPDHAESGEERFLIEWNESDNSVSFGILAFSRPNHILTRLAYSWVRRCQKRFARDAVAALQNATERLAHPPLEPSNC